METNNKSIIIVIAAVLVGAFFMPLIKVWVSINAWDLVFGDIGQKMINTPFRFAAIIIPLAGILIIYGAAFNKENYSIPKNLLFILPIATLILICISIWAKLEDTILQIKTSDIENVAKVLGIGFWVTLASSIILPFLGNTPKNQSELTEPLNKDYSPPQTNNQASYPRPQINVNVNLPKINWSKILDALKKYWLLLFVLTIASIGLIVSYYLFIKANPVEDAKPLANNYCLCVDESDKTNLSSMQSFLSEFDSKKFKTRNESKLELNRLMEVNKTKYNNCIQQADLSYKEVYLKYSSKEGEDSYILDQTYSSIINACKNSINSEIVSLQNKIDDKIKLIIDPEPDIDKIKGDLLGNEIPGWRFSYLNEYKTADILNSTKGVDRIEYQIKCTLTDKQTNDEHDCEIMVVYYKSDNGWYLNQVSMNYITYTYTFYPERYTQIEILQGCTWNADNQSKMSWKTSDWEYADETVTGPQKGATTLPYSQTYFIKSLEETLIKVRFTYRPQ